MLPKPTRPSIADTRNYAMKLVKNTKWIPGWEGKYSISETGTVWSYRKSNDAKPTKMSVKRGFVCLTSKGKKVSRSISRLIREMYVLETEEDVPVGFSRDDPGHVAVSSEDIAARLNKRISENQKPELDTGFYWIQGYEGRYSISKLGEVRSHLPTHCRRYGKKLKSSRANKWNYRYVGLSDGNRVRSWKVHRLVLETFVGPRPEGMQCRHLDGDASNNSLDNLCWGTPKENGEDRVRHGTSSQLKGYGRMLTSEQIQEVLSRFQEGESMSSIARRFSVNQGTIKGILGDPHKGKSPHIKLNPEIVREIRQKHSTGISQAELCLSYGLSIGAVSKLVRKISWRNV